MKLAVNLESTESGGQWFSITLELPGEFAYKPDAQATLKDNEIGSSGGWDQTSGVFKALQVTAMFSQS